MNFILGLIFGVAITFSGALFFTTAQSVEAVAQTFKQQMPVVVAETGISAPALSKGELITTPIEASPARLEDPGKTELAQAEWVELPEPLEQTELTEQTEPLAQAEALEQPTQISEPIWTEFHSEASASGFANYLSQSLDHPFEVSKLGPAQYQVYYRYSSAEQAQDLAAKINTITGAK